VRSEPSVLHLDLDAFFAAVEQRDKPSLQGRPVVVGGVGPRGVVSTASYEARRYGIRSAMSTAEARARCPNAAFLAPRFSAYRAASELVMAALAEVSPTVEPLSLDEAFCDLAHAPDPDLSPAGVRAVSARLKAAIRARTRLTGSVGVATSKLVAKVASDLDKPDGLRVVPAGSEQGLLDPLPVTRLWGVGPVTNRRLAQLGVRTIADLRRLSEAELVGVLGQAHGSGLFRLARAEDDRPVVPEQESKSVSVEDTFAQDVADADRLRALLDGLAARVSHRLGAAGLSGRTVTVKVRQHDFATVSRSATLQGPTDDVGTLTRVARRLLTDVDTTDGVRLLGVGVSSLTSWSQADLFAGPAEAEDPAADDERAGATHLAPARGGEPGSAEGPAAEEPPGRPEPRRWAPGQDVVHTGHGPGWVQGSGAGRVTVRFETRNTPPGRVRTFSVDDLDLRPGG